ncbi:MAG: hypothetical protein VCA73_19250 [Roseibacillus sp.]
MLEDSLSPYAEGPLRSKGICLSLTSLTKTPLCAQDLEKATRIIALNDREHRPMISELFPTWASRIE